MHAAKRISSDRSNRNKRSKVRCMVEYEFRTFTHLHTQSNDMGQKERKRHELHMVAA